MLWIWNAAAMKSSESQASQPSNKLQQGILFFTQSLKDVVTKMFSGNCCSVSCVQEVVKEDCFEILREKVLKPDSQDALKAMDSFDTLYRMHKSIKYRLPYIPTKEPNIPDIPTFTEEDKEILRKLEVPDYTLENEKRSEEATQKIIQAMCIKEKQQN